MGAQALVLEAAPFTKVCVRGALSSDSSQGSAPHYEVFVALRGLRNLSEENRDKVNDTGIGRNCVSLSLCMPAGALGTVQGEGRGGRGSWAGEPPWRLGKGRDEVLGHMRMHETPATQRGHHQAPLSHGPQSHTPASLRPFCSQLDHCLQEVSPHYKSLRFRGSVGPARVHLVGRGAFRELRAALAACPSSRFPPEMPRVLRHRHLAEGLQKRVLS